MLRAALALVVPVQVAVAHAVLLHEVERVVGDWRQDVRIRVLPQKVSHVLQQRHVEHLFEPEGAHVVVAGERAGRCNARHECRFLREVRRPHAEVGHLIRVDERQLLGAQRVAQKPMHDGSVEVALVQNHDAVPEAVVEVLKEEPEASGHRAESAQLCEVQDEPVAAIGQLRASRVLRVRVRLHVCLRCLELLRVQKSVIFVVEVPLLVRVVFHLH